MAAEVADADDVEAAATEPASLTGDEDRLKEEEASRAEAGTVGLLGEFVVSDAEPSREGDDCGWAAGDEELTGGVALSEAIGGEAGTALCLLLIVGEDAEFGSRPSSPSVCLSPPLPFAIPVAADLAMLDVFCSSSADGRLLKDADRKPLGVVAPLLPFFFQNASLANASEDVAAAAVGEDDD